MCKSEKKSDQQIILDAYGKYEEISSGKSIGQKQKRNKANEIFRLVDKYLFHFKSAYTTSVEKGKLIRKCKSLYQQYVSFKLGNPESVNNSLKNKMDTLVEQMSIYEATQVAKFRKSEVGGDRIDIALVFEDNGCVRQLVSTPSIYNLLKEAMKDRRFTIVSKTDQTVYITATGLKYHRKNCPYCKRVKLTETSYTKIQNAGYVACKCIGTTDKVLVKVDNKDQLEQSYMTVFIDESVRESPWVKFDESLADKQSSYSYIICMGNLESEGEITDENTVSRNACLSNEAHDPTYAAIEAINAVLMKLAFAYNFHGDVVIYTDNMGAKSKWYHKDSNMYLASLFDSVKVCHIPREQNKKADAVGRKMSFTNVPTDLVEQLLKMSKKYEKTKEQLDFVKNYFPKPVEQIPNFLEELELLAKEKKKGAKAS